MTPLTHLQRRTARHAIGATLVAVAASATLTTAAGKPGYPDKIVWNGEIWAVKTSRSAVGPGPNVFDKANVSVDAQNRLHLRIARNGSSVWTCSEIIAPASYGYGTYTFELASRVDALNANVVLGLFTWSDKAPYAHREIDVEFARWGNPADPTNAQYVVQPYDRPSHLERFTTTADATSYHRFMWSPGRVTWESYGTNGGLIDSYVYTGADVPRAGDERVHLNLWLFQGAAPTDGLPVDVVVSSFNYTP